MRTWTVSIGDGGLDRCGRCGRVVPDGLPVQRITLAGVARTLARCCDCADGDVDRDAIDAARQALADRQRAPSDPTQLKFARPTPRVSPTRKPVPFAAVADSLFDPRAAAANDREE